MHISDMLGQYNRNISSGTEELKAASGMQKVVSTLEELSSGSVFEGTVSSVKNGKVTLALSDGQTITARLSGKVPLSQGMPMFFQVKSNDGATIEIKPYTGAGSGGNPILTNALTEGTVPVTERNLAMVDAMMKEQMPIDKQSLLNMARIANMNPGVDITTVVNMTKLGIPVSPEMAAQFENYMTDEHAILQEMDQAMNELADLAGSSDLTPNQAVQMNHKILSILLPEQTATGAPVNTEGQIETGGQTTAEGQIVTGGQITAEGQIVTGGQTTAEGQILTDGRLGAEEQTVNGEQTTTAGQAIQEGTGGQALGEVLSEQQFSSLGRLLQNIPSLVESTKLFPEAMEQDIFIDTLEDESVVQNLMTEGAAWEAADGKTALDKNLTVSDFLRTVSQILSENNGMASQSIQKLFGSDAYKSLLRNVMEQQWLIQPEALKQEKKISQLYEKLEQQMRQVEDALKEAGVTKTRFPETAAEVRGNIEFMNQLNQAYTYVQVPLKMSGQNANGELYVYTNKKNLRDPDAELSAFLHLDLEHLGSTDVSVKMQHRNVKTNFYMADDASYDLVEKYLPVLEQKLKDKGYQCTITMTKEEKKVSFGDDFLRKDMPQTGTLHRYSFDVRA
ncbi:flagellar hook-length control protein FliK [Roseburia inulinivorans]|uniref:flagellar hook-length control protein FliK n=1 Tax=Roseburia inulinivorans TaxID=360807 RepID=UPI003FF0E1AC